MTSSSYQDRPITLRDLHEALKPILEILQRHEARFDAIENRLDTIEETLKEHSEILIGHKARFDSIEQTLKQHGETLKQHGETLKQHGETLKQHGDRLSAIEETVKVLKKFTLDNSARLDRIEKMLEELRNTRFNEVLTLQDQLVTMIKDRDMEDLMAVGKKDRHEEMLEDHERRLRAIERN